MSAIDHNPGEASRRTYLAVSGVGAAIAVASWHPQGDDAPPVDRTPPFLEQPADPGSGLAVFSFNTGLVGPGGATPPVGADSPAQMRLCPRFNKPGAACVSAAVIPSGLRRPHPELHGVSTRSVKTCQDHPDIPWDFPECAELVIKSPL